MSVIPPPPRRVDRQAPSQNWRYILREVYKGSSVGRALMHIDIQADVSIGGTVLDIGGGHRATYLKFIHLPAAERFIVIDIQPTPSVDVLGSVTDMPFRSQSIDTILCFNLLEHVFEHEAALREMHRVMKPGAVMYGWIPFLIGVHGDPHDYFRYTDAALHRLLAKSGFESIDIRYSGGAFLSAFDIVRPYIKGYFIGRIVRTAGAALALSATWFFDRIGSIGGYKYLDPADSPSGIWFIAKRR